MSETVTVVEAFVRKEVRLVGQWSNPEPQAGTVGHFRETVSIQIDDDQPESLAAYLVNYQFATASPLSHVVGNAVGLTYTDSVLRLEKWKPGMGARSNCLYRKHDRYFLVQLNGHTGREFLGEFPKTTPGSPVRAEFVLTNYGAIEIVLPPEYLPRTLKQASSSEVLKRVQLLEKQQAVMSKTIFSIRKLIGG